MSMVRRSSPFGELLSLRNSMDRLFEDAFVRPRGALGGGFETPVPQIDVHATPDALVLEAALPGVKPEDVEITSLGETLTISGTMGDEREDEENGYIYQELRRGRFTRSVTMPGDVDTQRATASFENGLLRLSFPKREESRPRQIRINPTIEGQSSTSRQPKAENEDSGEARAQG